MGLLKRKELPSHAQRLRRWFPILLLRRAKRSCIGVFVIFPFSILTRAIPNQAEQNRSH